MHNEYDPMRLRLILSRNQMIKSPRRNQKYNKVSNAAPRDRPQALPSYVLQDAIDSIEVSNSEHINHIVMTLQELTNAHVWIDGQVCGRGNIMLALCDSAITRAWNARRDGALRTSAAADEVADLLEICLQGGAVATQRFGPSRECDADEREAPLVSTKAMKH